MVFINVADGLNQLFTDDVFFEFIPDQGRLIGFVFVFGHHYIHIACDLRVDGVQGIDFLAKPCHGICKVNFDLTLILIGEGMDEVTSE